jgi:hypothetical protein
MKRVLFFLIAAGLTLPGKGQSFNPKNAGDTVGIWENITFEESTPYITILPLPQNTWQIGKPQKSFFDSAYTTPFAIVTDTVNPYPASNFSSFELTVINPYPASCLVDFRHKYDSDPYHDGGYITVSWDNGSSWHNIITDWTGPYGYFPANPGCPWLGNENQSNSILFNGEPGFSGHSAGWEYTCMAWYTPIVSRNTEDYGMRLRFNFISDTSQQNMEGWLIDNIRVFSIDMGQGIRDFLAGSTLSWFYPNPVINSAAFTMNRTYSNVHYELSDSHGSVVRKVNLGNCSEFTFKPGDLPPGIYCMRLFMGSQYKDIHRIVIAP